MTQNIDSSAKTEIELKTQLRQLLGDDALAYVNLQWPDRADGGDAQKKHNARTARYKKAQAVNLAPDSEAVGQACSYILLEIIGSGGNSSTGLFTLTMKELIAAGYDQEKSRASILRLIRHVNARKTDWQRRTRQRLGRQVIEALRKARGNE